MVCGAAVNQWAPVAMGRAVCAANAGTEIHQRLVEIARTVRWHQRSGQFFERFCRRGHIDGAIVGGNPAENAQHITVDGADTFAKCDRGDGTGGVGTDTGKCEQRTISFR